MSIFNKTFVKFAVGFGAIILLAVGFVAYGGAGKYLQERAAKKAIAEYEAKLAADTYGGKTPEETLALFIDALKKGDVDLASKYFIAEKQVETKNDLLAGQKSGGVKTLLKIYSLNNVSSHHYEYDNTYEFRYKNSDGAIALFGLVFNKYSNIWKIESL